jgi:Flp pilus assembly protein TadD
MADIYLLINGAQEGPYTEDQVRQSLSEGLIPADLPAWHEGLADWLSVANVLDRSARPILPKPISQKSEVSRHSKAFVGAVGVVLALALVTGVCFFSRPSISKETFRTGDNTAYLTVVSGSEIEYTDKDGTFLGTYELQGDNLRVIITELGTPQVFYLKRVNDGWQDQSGVLFLSPSYYAVAQLYNLGNDRFDKGDFDGAIADYNQVIETFPSYADAFTKRGEAERQKGNLSAAITDYKKALQLDPKNDASDKLQEAMSEQLQQIEDRQDKLIQETGLPAFRTSKEIDSSGTNLPTDERIKSFQQAVQNSPNDARAYSNLGIAYLELKQYDNAINTLSSAVKINANDAMTHNDLGYACAQKGFQEVAEKEFSMAIEIDPNFRDAHFNLGIIYATERPPTLDLARQEYHKALNLGATKDPQMESLLK